MKIKNCKWIKPQTVEDGKDGNLVIIENMKDIPFNIKRVYYIHSLIDSTAVRGCHSHRYLEQVMFCLNGSFKLELNDGFNKEFYLMNISCNGIYIGSNVWRVMTEFKNNCLIMVLASNEYDESDYIRNYNKFLKSINYDE